MTKTSECNKSIDYSKVTDDRVLPFVFELNLKDSNLYPDEGEKQRFCYTVSGVGSDTTKNVD